jgi:hypothetical protein
MTNPTIKIANSETGEEIEREMDALELEQHKKDQEEAQAQANAVTVKATEKAALLAKLGITPDEAKLLLS